MTSGIASGEYVTKQRDVAPLFATKFTRKAMTAAIKVGLFAFALIAAAYVVETRMILVLESSDNNGSQVYEYKP
jgi:hypothetical protein